MKTSTKILCILGLVALFSVLIWFISWKKDFASEYPIPANINLTYGDIYMLNLFNHRYKNNYSFKKNYSKTEKCYLKRLRKKGYIDDKDHIIDSTILDNIPDQTKYVGMVFKHGAFFVDPRSFMYPWSEDLTKRGFYTSAGIGHTCPKEPERHYLGGSVFSLIFKEKC